MKIIGSLLLFAVLSTVAVVVATYVTMLYLGALADATGLERLAVGFVPLYAHTWPFTFAGIGIGIVRGGLDS